MPEHPRTPWISPLEGGHPIISPLKDALDHVKQAAESNAGVNLVTLRVLIADLKHHLAFLEAKCR